MKAYMGIGCIDPGITDLATSLRSVVSFTLGERAHDNPRIGGWVGSTAGLDAVERR
jgi:hypothetical protein